MKSFVAARSWPRWLWSVPALLALACGNLRSSPHDTSESSGGDPSTGTPTAGTASGADSAGGATNGFGGTTGGVMLVIPTAGMSNNTPVQPEGGSLGAGGQPDYPADVSLCIYPADIPANWDDSAVDANGCATGELGGFSFMGCHYELLSTTAFNVDPFSPGHSRCCYKSRLDGCK